MTRPVITSLLLLAAIAAGCGGPGGDPDADPAAIVPADAPVYAEATLELGEDERDVARRLSGTDDPAGELEKLFERAVDEDGGDFTWDEDVKPWIGDRVGLFVTSLPPRGAGTDAEVALVAPTEDPDQAQEVLERELRERAPGEPAPKVAERTHRDVAYLLDTGDDEAVAIVEDYALTGTEQAIRGAIDAAEGDALAGAKAFKRARDEVTAEGVGFGYVRSSALISALGPQGAALRPLLGRLGDTLAFAVGAGDGALRVESAALGVRGRAAGAGPGEVLGTLPGDAWLALGLADVGDQLEQALQQFGQLGALGGVDVEQVLGRIEQRFGIDVREDLIGWMGDGGLFVRGSSVSEVGGALVVESSDAARTERVVPRLGRLLRDLAGARVTSLERPGLEAGVTLRFAEMPLPVHLAAAGDRFVLAVTDGALDAALDADEPLSRSPAYRRAGEQLGDGLRPGLFLDVAPVRMLLGETGALRGRGAEQVERVLERLTTVVAGSEREGDVSRGRLVVGVR